MRRTFLTLFAAAMVATPAFADWGTITLDIKAWDGDSWEDSILDPSGSLTSVPIQVWASATTGGSEGTNNGVQALYFNIVGSALDTVMQQSMQLDANLIQFYFPGFGYYGLGFDQLISPGAPTPGTSGTGAIGQIAGVGAAQQPPTGPGSMDMPGAMTANAPYAQGQPPVLVATGTVFTNGVYGPGNPSPPPGYTLGSVISTEGNGAFWKPDTNAGDSIIVDDVLWISTVPEPSTLILLVPALLGLRRRR